MSNDVFRLCAIIPSYNHFKELPRIVNLLQSFAIPAVIVDDGNIPPLENIEGATILRHVTNQGKGAAVITGFKYALDQGFTHALQVDADGQHDLNDITRFMALGAAHPEALVLGVPRFDNSAPRIRRWGRKLSVWVVWLETWSRKIPDPLCGYRLYPLSSTKSVLSAQKISPGMGFDPEIAVHLFWQGVPIKSFSTAVIYPANGISNFRYFKDNVAMISLHGKLLCKAIRRAVRGRI